MKLLKKFNSKRGFTLAELVIVVAIIAILAGIAVTFINPKDISYVEYNRSAEAIATAVQNRLTEIRNSGNMEYLRRMGEQYVSATGAAKAEVPSGDGSGETPGDTSKDLGGYRYVFNYNESGGAIERNSLISYILPFGAIDYDLAQNFYAIGFQSDTGMVGEVFYSTMPFAGHSASYLLTISGDSEQAKQKRKAENVGYYQGTTYEEEVAFANLPTPQLTITNYETAKIAQKYEQKLKWLKKLQTLDDLKTLMERLIYEVDHETGTDKDGRPYNYGGYYTDTSGNIYLDLDRARIDDYDDVKNHHYIKVTLVEALHAIYDGTYNGDIIYHDANGETKTHTETVTIEYKGDDVNKPNFNSIGNHTFMSYYNELKKQYEILADGSDEAKVKAAKERLTLLLGDNSGETYQKPTEHSDGTTTSETKRFYEGGIFYQSFESELLYRLFDKAKDFYQIDKNDKTGELIYRHFRSDYIESGFVKLLCDLAMSDEGRAKMLTDAKTSELDSALTMLETYDSIAGKWKGDMKSFTTEAQGLISKAKTAVEGDLERLSYSFTITVPDDSRFGTVNCTLVMTNNYDLTVTFVGENSVLDKDDGAEGGEYAITVYWQAEVEQEKKVGTPKYDYYTNYNSGKQTQTDTLKIIAEWKKENVTISRGEVKNESHT